MEKSEKLTDGEVDGLELLATAIIKQASVDYIREKRKVLRNPENKFAQGKVDALLHFFYSEWFAYLSGVDSDWLLERLDKRAEDRAKSFKWCQHSGRSKQVAQYDVDGSFVCVHESLQQANQSVGATDSTSIRRCCNGEQEIAYGYMWKWHEGEKE